MRMRVTKNWDPLADSYQLTKQDIESQVLGDLAKYRHKYSEKYNKPAPIPLDVDNYVNELWGFGVVFENVAEDSAEKETLGFLRPETQDTLEMIPGLRGRFMKLRSVLVAECQTLTPSVISVIIEKR